MLHCNCSAESCLLFHHLFATVFGRILRTPTVKCISVARKAPVISTRCTRTLRRTFLPSHHEIQHEFVTSVNITPRISFDYSISSHKMVRADAARDCDHRALGAATSVRGAHRMRSVCQTGVSARRGRLLENTCILLCSSEAQETSRGWLKTSPRQRGNFTRRGFTTTW
jgi:hypothetical protein